jgi:hypothetical protein
MGDTTTRMPDKYGRPEAFADTGGWLSAGTTVLLGRAISDLA